MKLRPRFKNWSPESKESAFTFTELLVVIIVIVLLVLVFLPAHAASRPRSQSVRCVDSLHEIMRAVMLYTRDNHDLFPPNEDTTSGPAGHVWVSGNAGVNGAQQFNPDILANPTLSLLTTYINTNISLFRCPADLRVGVYQGTDPAKLGTKVPAARSIAMNGAVGTRCTSFPFGHGGALTVPVDGPWLNNTHSHTRNLPWRTYGKLSEAMIPGPAKLWVAIEEDAYSLNDAILSFGMNNAEWIDFPATRHAMSGAIAFADGRAELHKWVDQRTRVINGFVARKPVPGSADWTWLAERTTARAQ